MHNNFFTLKYGNNRLIFLDQTKLPSKEEYVKTSSYERVAEAIERLEIRGAPAIGIAAAYGLSLSLQNTNDIDINDKFFTAYTRLKKTRPTAVNLFYALDSLKQIFESGEKSNGIADKLLEKAKEIHTKDIYACDNIGENGLEIFSEKCNVLTHCNTGKLATGGDGTALNVIKKAFHKGFINKVYVDETRPLLQGSRLTAFELYKEEIPFSVLTDSSAASLFTKKEIDLVIVGADRITTNGDTANKIGTYNLSVLCNYHKIPFYIAAPTTTIDLTLNIGDEIKIEYRQSNELFNIIEDGRILKNFNTYSPAFDVTPSKLITGIITESKIYKYPYNFKFE